MVVFTYFCKHNKRQSIKSNICHNISSRQIHEKQEKLKCPLVVGMYLKFSGIPAILYHKRLTQGFRSALSFFRRKFPIKPYSLDRAAGRDFKHNFMFCFHKSGCETVRIKVRLSLTKTSIPIAYINIQKPTKLWPNILASNDSKLDSILSQIFFLWSRFFLHFLQ